MEYGILSLIPPLAAIILAFLIKDAMVALFVAGYVGFFIISGFQPFTAFGDFLNGIVASFQGRWLVIIVICLGLAYGLSRLIEESGGGNGLIEFLTGKHQLVKNKRQSGLLTWAVGVVLFMNATLSIVLTGVITQPLNEKFKMSREKQAFIIKTTGPPVCGLIPVGQWGGVLVGMMTAANLTNTGELVVKVVGLNFYCIITVITLFILLVTGKDFGPMKRAEERAEQGIMSCGDSSKEPGLTAGSLTAKVASPLFVFVPILMVLLVTIGYMIYSGEGHMLSGDAVGGILWGMIIGSVAAMLMNVATKNFTFGEVIAIFVKGMGEAMPIMIIMVLAVTLGSTVSTLGTGYFLANVFHGVMSPALLPALIFVIGCLVGYATGSATSNITTMFPIVIPWAMAANANLALAMAAAWSAAWFGDHVSPISDSAFMSAGIVNCNVFDHVKTTTPYGLVWAAASLVCFLVAGVVL